MRNASAPTRTRIPFHRPWIGVQELDYVTKAVTSGFIGSDGVYTRRCAEVLEARFGIAKVLMTASCTMALELAALLCELQPGDEVILPSFTFASTANAFLRCGRDRCSSRSGRTP